jgi:hypothetical protein
MLNGSTGRLVWDAPQGAAPLETASAGGASRFQAGGAEKAAVDDRGADARIRAALAQRVEEVAFEDTPLADVVAYLTELMGVNVHVHWARLEDYGVARETAVSMKLHDVTVERVLRLVLNEIREVPVDYQIEDGVLLISTQEGILRNLTTQVYDVRDLLGAPRTAVGPGALARMSPGKDGSFTPSAAGAAGARPEGASSSVVSSALDKIVQLTVQDHSLETVMAWLTAQSGVNVVVEWEELSQNGVERDSPISLALKDLPLRTVLAEVLRKAGRSEVELAYAIEDGLLRIATRERLVQIGALPQEESGGLGTSGRDEPDGDFDVAADELVAMIQRAIEPWSWEANGADNGGHLEVYRGLLVARTAGPMHEKLARLLNDMRGAATR